MAPEKLMVGVYCDYMVLVLVLFVAAHAQRNSEESGHTYYSFIHTMDKYLFSFSSLPSVV
jgi:hypothetical protein